MPKPQGARQGTVNFAMPAGINSSIKSLNIHYKELKDLNGQEIIPFIKVFHSLCLDYMVFLLQKEAINARGHLHKFPELVDRLNQIRKEPNPYTKPMKSLNTVRNSLHHPDPESSIRYNVNDLHNYIKGSCSYIRILYKEALELQGNGAITVIILMEELATRILTELSLS